jgi:hypothetical protein
MPLDNLYSDVFNCVLDFLELDEIARLSTMNRSIYDMCTGYVPMVSNESLSTLRHRTCHHSSCQQADKSSVQSGYCKKHIDQHTCEDCHTVRAELDKVEACVEGCCEKSVCRLEDGGCPPLQCIDCKEYYEIFELYKNIYRHHESVCHHCYLWQRHTYIFSPRVTWHGLSHEEWQNRLG